MTEPVNLDHQAWSIEPNGFGAFSIVLSGAPPIAACPCCTLPFRTERAARRCAEALLLADQEIPGGVLRQ